MSDLLKYEHIDLFYDHRHILKDITLTVPEHKTLAIVGESGSGKSTLLKLTLQLLSNQAMIKNGRILYKGQDLLTLNKKQWLEIRGKEIAMIFQNANQYFDPRQKIKSQYEELMYHHFKMNKENSKKEAIRQFNKMALKDPKMILNKYPFELSGGMAQRVAITFALSLKPKLLLADEPTSSLDVTGQKQILEELQDLKQNEFLSLLLVTHNIAVAGFLADEIAVMKDGEIVEFGSKQQILQQPQHPYTQLLLEAVEKWEFNDE